MYTVASVQMDVTLFQPKENLNKIHRLLHEAADMGAKLIVFPECALSGYALTPDEANEVAEPIPGPTTSSITEVCTQRDLFAVTGMIERYQENLLFNSTVLVGSDGVIGCYRKTHLPFLGVDRYLAQGGLIPQPFETPLGSLGMLICYDLRFPEPLRVLSLLGAQVVLVSTAWPASASLYPDFMIQARSAENSIYLLSANRVGEERGTRYLGRSIITGPNGEVLVEGDSETEEILLAEIDPRLSVDKKRVFKPGEYELDLFNDRRPELYGALAAHGTVSNMT
jgi:predicted amidohydrolase